MRTSFRLSLRLLGSIALMGGSGSTWAACSFGTPNLDINHDFGSVYVPRDAPIGSIIGRLQNVRGIGRNFSCSTNSLAAFVALNPLLPDVPIGGFSPPPGKIIATNISGIGVILSCGGPLCAALDPIHGGATYPFTNPAVPYRDLTSGSGIRGTLIKTSPIDGGAGPLTLSGDVLRMDSNDGTVFTLRLSGMVTVSGCSVPSAPGNNIPVPMGNVPQRAFQGPGSSASAVNFNITLNSCIAGTYTPAPGGFVQGNFANIQLDAIRGSTMVDADRGILGLSPSANPDEDATGVAVQVLQNDGTTPMTLGMPVQLNRITDGTTLVPLKARYIQIGDGHAPTPGLANAYASFTVTYR